MGFIQRKDKVIFGDSSAQREKNVIYQNGAFVFKKVIALPEQNILRFGLHSVFQYISSQKSN